MKPFAVDISEGVELDMLGEVRAGFPSLADEEPTEKLDLVKLLVRHPSSTFFFRIGGTSMVDAEMDEGDIVRDIEDGAGRWVRNGESEALAEAIRQMQRDPQAHAAMRSTCRKLYLEKYTTEICTKKYVDLFRHLL